MVDSFPFSLNGGGRTCSVNHLPVYLCKQLERFCIHEGVIVFHLGVFVGYLCHAGSVKTRKDGKGPNLQVKLLTDH